MAPKRTTPHIIGTHTTGPTHMDGGDLDPIAHAILAHLASHRTGKPVSPEAVARDIADQQPRKAGAPPSKTLWRRYFQAVKDQAFHLARTGQIEITRKGKPVAASDLKGMTGIWRLRLPTGEAPQETGAPSTAADEAGDL